MIFRVSWLTLGMFSAALAGGATPPQTPPLLTWFSLFLVRSSANFAKKIQELAEDKAENPRTCRGQSREKKIRTDAYNKTNISKLCSSKLLSLSQTSLLQKRWAAVLPPGGLQLNKNSCKNKRKTWHFSKNLLKPTKNHQKSLNTQGKILFSAWWRSTLF